MMSKGGDVGQPGNGAMGGTIEIDYKTLIKDPPPINATVTGGKAGVQSGTEGAGGKGKVPGGKGTVDKRPPMSGDDGTVTINGSPQ